MMPFLTLYTPTYKRPTALAACLASVANQTAVDAVEQIVVVDHVGVGVSGMYARIPQYVDAVHGDYVHVLGDDDVLATPFVVEQLQNLACLAQQPPVILVRAKKGPSVWPQGLAWPPRMGAIDLGCVITRADVWKAHATDYGHRYEGDFDFMHALWMAGHVPYVSDLLFSIGAVSRGAAEVAA